MKKESREIRKWGIKWLKAEIGPREVFVVAFFFKMDEIITCLYIDDSDLVEGKQ